MHLDIFLKSFDAQSISMIFRSNSSGTSFIAALSLLIAAGMGCLYFFNKEVTQLLGTSVYLMAPNATVTIILHASIDSCISSFFCWSTEKKPKSYSDVFIFYVVAIKNKLPGTY